MNKISSKDKKTLVFLSVFLLFSIAGTLYVHYCTTLLFLGAGLSAGSFSLVCYITGFIIGTLLKNKSGFTVDKKVVWIFSGFAVFCIGLSLILFFLLHSFLWFVIVNSAGLIIAVCFLLRSFKKTNETDTSHN